MFYQYLIVDFAPVDSCVVRRYKTFQISQRVTHKCSQKFEKRSLGFPFICGEVGITTKKMPISDQEFMTDPKSPLKKSYL